MKKRKHKDMTESLYVGILLAMVGGYLVAYTYIARGGVFANAQTGNFVNLSINLANGNFIKVFYYLIPIFSFTIGIFMTNVIRDLFIIFSVFHWKQIIVVIQIILLSFVGSIGEGDGNMIANAIISFVCAMQFENFRTLNGNSITTTICTGNLRSGTSQLYEYIRTKERSALYNAIQYYAILFSFAVGVIIGTWAVNILSIKAVYLACFPLLVAFFLMFMKDNSLDKVEE